MRRSMQLTSSMFFSALLLHVAPTWAKPWKGAELITQQTFRYGAFEARIRAAGGSGLITPFFLWKNDSELPGQRWQEQDFEIFGSSGGYQTQLMTPGEGGAQRTEHVTYHSLPAPAWERYYTYRMEWTPEYLAFYVDGELVRVETDAEEFEKLMSTDQAEPAQLRVSLWAGDTGWSGSFDETAVPTASFVNWIQTFSYTPGSGPNGSDFSPLWRDDFSSPTAGAPDPSRWWAANWTFDYAVNDYVPQNARVQAGTLVLAFTDEAHAGAFPAVPPDQGGASSGGSTSGSAGPSVPDSCEDGSAVYAAEAMSASAGGPSSDGWNLWSNGSLTKSHAFPGGDAVISVRARGQFGGGAWPHMRVTVGSETIGDVVVDSSGYADYDFLDSVSAGSRQLGVWFDNDFASGNEDRNLFVDTLAVELICE